MSPFAGVEGPINAYATVVQLPDPPLPIVAHRDRHDGELMEHLSGLQGWIWSHVQDGAPSPIVAHAMEHCWRVHHQVVFEMTPGADAGLADWAEGANALLFFPDSTLRSARGEVLVGGLPTEGADVPYTHDGWARKARNETTLQTMGVQCGPQLPPSPGASEVIFREADEVLARANALVTVALRASSLAEKNPIPMADLEARFQNALFTEYETSFLGAEDVPAEALPQFSWRYEALTVLLWALELIPDLPPPSGICDTGQLIGVMTGDLPSEPRLRSAAELLDALDAHYRMHWWVRTCEGAGQPSPFIHGVVHERRTAFTWLIRLGELDWENIPLPT